MIVSAFKRPRDFARALALFTAPYQPQARKGVALPLRFPVPAFSLPRFSSEEREICRALFRQIIRIFVEI